MRDELANLIDGIGKVNPRCGVVELPAQFCMDGSPCRW